MSRVSYSPGFTGSALTIRPLTGFTFTVNITGGTVTSDAAGTTNVTFPQTVSAATTYYSPDNAGLVVSCIWNGVECANSAGSTFAWLPKDGQVATITPEPTRAQGEASDSAAYAPSKLPAVRQGQGFVNLFDPARYVYNRDGLNLRKWRAALANSVAGGGYARLLTVGNSITFGQYCTPTAQGHAWPDLLRAKLDAKFGAAGTGRAFLIGGNSQGWIADDTRFVLTGTSNVAGYGAFNAGVQQSTGPTQTITFTANCDSFTIYYIDQTVANGNSFTWKVDAGAPTTVNTQGSAANTAGKVTVSAGTVGTHTLTIAATTGKVAYFAGVEASIGSTGVRVDRCGLPGAVAWQAYGAASDATLSGATAFEFTVQPPDLTIIEMGENEYLSSMGRATFSGYLHNLINAAQVSGDVLLMTTVPNGSTSIVPAQSEYDNEMYSLADALNLPLLDLSALWQSYGTSNGAPFSYYANTTHPNNKGHGAIAQAIYDAILVG